MKKMQNLFKNENYLRLITTLTEQNKCGGKAPFQIVSIAAE